MSVSIFLRMIQPRHGLCKRCIINEAAKRCLAHVSRPQSTQEHDGSPMQCLPFDIVSLTRVFSWTFGWTWWYLNCDAMLLHDA